MLPVVRVVVVVMLLVVFPVVRLELGVVAGDCGVFYQVFLFVLMALIWVLLLSMLLFFFFFVWCLFSGARTSDRHPIVPCELPSPPPPLLFFYAAPPL